MVSHYLLHAAAREQEAASTKAYLFEFYGDRFNNRLPTLEEAYSEWNDFLENGDANLTETRNGVKYIKSSYVKGAFTDPEYENERQRWYRRKNYEEALLESIVDYYNAKADAEWNQVLAHDHQAQLDTYLALKSSYG
jgi:hypothetical protein